MPTLQNTTGTREYQEAFLNQISFRLLTSDMSYQKEGDLVYYLLDSNGRLLIQQVAPDYAIGQSLFEQFIPRWSANRPFHLAYYAKQGGSLVGGIAEALSSVGAGSLSNLQSLDEVYALIHSQHVPSASRYFTIMDDSSNISLNLTRNHKTFQDRNFYDLSHEEVPHNFKLVRNHISNFYEAGISLNNVPCNSIQVQGLDVVALGNDEFRLGPVSALAPVITLSVSNNPLTVEAALGQTMNAPSATAVDFQGNSQVVNTNPASIDLGTLGPATIIYSCQTSTGELASTNLVINRVDTTSPQLTLLPDPVSGNINFEVELNGIFSDPGATAFDLVDGDLTSQIQVTGTVDPTVAALYSINYSVVDSSNLGAQAVRSVTVKEPVLFESTGTYTSCAFYPTGLGSSMTSQPDLMSVGQGSGYQLSFKYKVSSDPQGVAFAITDSSLQSTYYETPATTACGPAFRLDQTAGVKVRFPQSHPSWGSSRYFGDAAGVANPTQQVFTEVVLRVWDSDSANYRMSLQVGSNSTARDLAKSGSGSLFIVSDTQGWTGFSTNCVETNGAPTTSAGWRVEGGEVKDISIRSFTL